MTKTPNITPLHGTQVQSIENDIAAALKSPLPTQVSVRPNSTMPGAFEVTARPVRTAAPDYAVHRPDVPEIGKITAEAVAIDYEAAAKEIEALGKQLTELQARVEKEAQAVHDAIAEVKGVAASYRDEGMRLFNMLEEASLLTKSVRETCTALASKIGGSK